MIGKVFTWSRDAGWRELEHSDLPTPNGILATPDGRTIFVAAYIRREVVEFSVSAHAVRTRSVKLAFMPDNLRWGPRGSLLVAGQNAPMSDIARCAGSADAECDIRAAIAVIDPVRFAVTCERPVPLSFATTAVAAELAHPNLVSDGDAVLRLSPQDLSPPACASASQPTESKE
jgi:hypothetical protein